MTVRSDEAELGLQAAEIHGVHRLTVSGDVDSAVEVEFRAGLDKAVAGANSPLVIDLGGVRYFDARGVSALVEAQKQMNARPDNLYIAVTSPIVRRLFSLLGLDKFFDVYGSVDDAMAAAEKGKLTAP